MKIIMKLILIATFIIKISAISFAQNFNIINADDYWLSKLKLKVENAKVHFYQMNFNTDKLNIGIIDKNFISFLNSNDEVVVDQNVQLITYKDDTRSWIYYKNLSDYLDSKSNEEANSIISGLVGIKVDNGIDNTEIILWYNPEILKSEKEKSSDNQTYKYDNQILLFPNPLKGNIITAKFNNIKPGKYSLIIYDINGNEMMTKLDVELNNNSLLEIQTPDLNAGMYALVAISAEGEKLICKFIKDDK